MARPISAPLRALLGAARFRQTVRLELTDQNGVWTDVTNWLGTNWFDRATWTENQDQPVSTGTVTLVREDRGVSMAPHMGGSPVNHLGAAYAPFIREGGGVRISIAYTPPGVVAAAPDFIEAFVGTYDSWKTQSGENTLDLECRGRGSYIVDTLTREKKTYAKIDAETGEGGRPAETVIQDILNDWLGAGVVALYTPVPSGTFVANIDVDIGKSTMEAARDIALSIGWDLRYRYDAAGVSRLTFYKPGRTSAPGAESIWFAANEYLAVPRLETSVVDTRQIVRVDFTDAETEEPDFVEVEDAAALAAYGPPRGPKRWMQLAFKAGSPINTKDEATTLANAALSDLAWPYSDHDLELFPCWWPVQLGDYIGVRANTKVYDSDQSFGVFGFTHTLENSSGSTTLVTKGRVVGAFKEWLRRSGSELGNATGGSVDTRALALKNFREIRRTPEMVRYGWDVPEDEIAEIWAWEKQSLQETQPPTVGAANEDRLWRATENEPPDKKLTDDTVTFDVAVPPFGSIETWELVPVDATGKRGYPQRVKVLSAPDVPRLTNLETAPGISELFCDLSGLNVVDPQALGGTLRAWLNHTHAEDADPRVAPDGTLVIAVTPYTVTPADPFVVDTAGSTNPLFDNLRIHPGAGKRIFFEFINTNGTSSGVIAFIVLGNGAVIDANGQLKDAAIIRAGQFAATIQPYRVYEALPPQGEPNELAVLSTSTPPGKTYRWTGTATTAGAWVAINNAPELEGLLTGGQIAAHNIGLAQIATNIAPPEIFPSLPAGAPGVNRIALVNGTLYRSSSDGGAWTNTAGAIAAADITGQIARTQIALAAIDASLLAANAVTSTAIADGSIQTPKIATGAVVAGTIAAGAVTTPALAAGAVTAVTIAAGAVIAGKIAALAIDATNLQADSVVAGKLAAAAVNTRELVAGAVTATIIGAGEVQTVHMVAGSINGDRITANTLHAAKIVSGSLASLTATIDAVSAGVLSAGAIAASAMATNSIGPAMLQNGSVGPLKIAVTMLQEITQNAGIIIAGKLQGIAGAYLDLNATGANPFISHPSIALYANGNATFSGAISGSSGTFGTVTAGLFQSADGLRWLWLNATGSQEFIKHPSLTVRADGTATFGGAVSSSSFTTTNATFSGAVNMTGTLAISAGSYGADPQGSVRFYDALAVLRGRIFMEHTGGSIPVGMHIEYGDAAVGGGLFLEAAAVGWGVQLKDLLQIIDRADSTTSLVVDNHLERIFKVGTPASGGPNGETGLSIYWRNDSGVLQLKQVYADTANSQGTGYRALRILN